ncbi:HNH endonuclease [Cellulomonas sp. P24]|uniref:HNH endonuclease n=1 Tax=Cellulomonas sp. P24 TaxID=2885206 RepID=UPI00216AF141|nr:hypothetical protein [Cellulomonas sp. P24]MCR6491442.1 hypothetical protein [Cellulomonas sp. P24]
MDFEFHDEPVRSKPAAEPWDASERPCPRCAQRFTPRLRTQKYCSPDCRQPPTERSCAHCGKSFTTTTRRKIYCSVRCRETVKAARYAESARERYGTEMPESVKVAIDVKRHLAARGGYRVPGREVSPRLRQEVVERDQGLCQECGQPGTEVDHLFGDHSELDLLQLLCAECHAKKTIPMLAYFMKGEPGIGTSIQVLAERMAKNAHHQHIE